MTFAKTPEPPYYTVIFSAVQSETIEGYAETALRMESLAKTMPGYLGIESARNKDGFGITVSYWESEEAIAQWKREAEHLDAQRRGRNDWYERYQVRVAKVERSYQHSNA